MITASSSLFVLTLFAGCPSAEPVPIAPEPVEVVPTELPVPVPVVDPVAVPVPEPVAVAEAAAPKPVAVVAPVAEPVAVPVPVEVPVPVPVPPVQATAADYTLVPGKNALFVIVKFERGTLGANLAHDHVIVATTYSGTVHWDPANPAACQVSIDVPTSGLRVDPPGARAKAGLEGETPPESDRPKIEENFNSGRQLDSARFPVLKFRSTGCVAADPGTWNVTGGLTIHGVSRPTTARMVITVEGDRFAASGRFGAKHADFGMDPFSAAMGAVRNAEALTFVVDVAGTRASRPTP